MHVKDTSQTYHKLLILQNHTKSISYRYANSIKNAFFVHLCTNMSLQQPILEGCSPHTYLELLQPLSSFPQNPWYLGLRSSQKARFLSWWFQVISRNVSGASLRPWMMGILCVKCVPFFVNLKPTPKKRLKPNESYICSHLDASFHPGRSLIGMQHLFGEFLLLKPLPSSTHSAGKEGGNQSHPDLISLGTNFPPQCGWKLWKMIFSPVMGGIRLVAQNCVSLKGQ